jgi:hypothetical protein
LAQAKTVTVILVENAFCECCGRPTAEIKQLLAQVPFVNDKRQVGKHSQYKTHPQDIYDDCTLNNCGVCGTKLPDADIKIAYNYPHEPNEVLGYKCSCCGNRADF